jgi:hypothetical protein
MGGIPCQIDHGSIKNRLKWNLNIDINCNIFNKYK